MTAVCLDAGALIAVERSTARIKELLEGADRAGLTLIVPSPVIAQVWRGSARQARLARFLKTRTHEVELGPTAARAVGLLCAATGTADIVDAHVVLVARLHDAAILTSDPDDIRHLDPSARVVLV